MRKPLRLLVLLNQWFGDEVNRLLKRLEHLDQSTRKPRRTHEPISELKGHMVHRFVFVATLFAASILAACAAHSTPLAKHQFKEPLNCPCPTIAPLMTVQLPGEVPFGSGAYIGGIATGPDGNVWVAESDANRIARVTVGGVVTEFSSGLSPNAGPELINPGPDGNLWFTELNYNTIGRITTSGVITEFPLPAPLSTAPSNLQDIHAGPDGNLWFTHSGANAIGVLSTSGTLLATYNVPTANATPTFIIAGPDNNLWFVEETGDKIGRITTTGTMTEFIVPTANSVPKNLAVGIDGNMWFPERDGANVDRITTAGLITEFPVPATIYQDRLRRITATPDGYLWFVQAEVFAPYNSEVGKMDTNGTVLDLWSFPNGLPQAITTGPDGNPWFTDNATDSVIRL